ncbi:hypothetical protein BZG02_12440 [Labilibaculum filiforme]|uniref:Uncharacterized protein n=1 Tax=Labilibaculum filiforme TaxID=1940526 RepID=A0A2N3HWT1_9BACT|nr:hypothetical protein [Labilibaculum filiforme]PKQ62525.1 hypothetical protein BZG02_12440 [Labilibaculum filiforme]
MLNTRIIASLFLFLSAYSPLWGIFLIQDLNFETWELSHPILVWIGIGISIFSCAVILFAVKQPKISVPPVKVIKASNRSGDLLNYSIPYMVSFFALDLDSINSLLSFTFFMLILYLLTLKTHSIFINPTLALFGYNLYNISYEQNSEILDKCCLVKGSKPKKDSYCRIIDLSENISLITQINPKI